jgi:uncharacterized protein YjbI with pentapeptide repeats
MADNWQNLAKNATDPTIIDEAIDQAIVSHNNDPDAHMLADEALDIHRSSVVVDHLAESVVNDKLQIYARAYVAIVDPADDSSFDSIDGAYAYAVSVGGGTILITPGTHYLGASIDLNENIDVVGTDRDTCILVTDGATSKTFDVATDSIASGRQMKWEHLTFAPSSDIVIDNTTGTYTAGSRVVFNDCKFINRHFYLASVAREMIFNECYFDLGTTGAIEFYSVGIFNNCEFDNSTVSTEGKLINGFISDGYLSYDQCYSRIDITGNINLFGTGVISDLIMTGCQFTHIKMNDLNFTNAQIIGNYFDIESASYFNIVGDQGIFVGNKFIGGTGNRVRVPSGSDENIVTNNHVGTEITIAGAKNYINNNKTTTSNGYFTTATTDTALNFSNNEVVYQEPSATKTLTTTVPPAGTVRTLILKQTNTTAKTMTFGTGFKTTGTLALGTTANRWFTLIFVSDGTRLIQIARSTAIA